MLDIDATDDPTHGAQQLSLFDGYRKQYQYKPLLVFEGESGFPLGGHLRPGTAHDSWGTAEVLHEIVEQLRSAWPEVPILVRGDCGFALPAVYDFCEAENLTYALGLPSNAVLKRQLCIGMTRRVLHRKIINNKGVSETSKGNQYKSKLPLGRRASHGSPRCLTLLRTNQR